MTSHRMLTQLTSSNCNCDLEASSSLSITEKGTHLEHILPLFEASNWNLIRRATCMKKEK